jgi:NADH:ubiquinone oxidoreductase subunit F (NADH-binding)
MNSTARERSVRSFFADSSRRGDAVRVCRGLSCALNGGPLVEARVAGRAAVHPVACLGLCDRSPALLLPDDRAVTVAAAAAWPDEAVTAAGSRPDIRCAARRPIVTERIARGDHSALTVARRAGVYEGLSRALRLAPGAVVELVTASGEQGRGGAGFPTASKWRAAAAAAGGGFVIANGDEGDPGSFVDRVLLEDDPHAVLEGLAICAHAVGAREGIVYIRGEYPRARRSMEQAIVEAREAGWLGPAVMGTSLAFDARVVSGHGSYVCGEETALLEAIEGRRGEARLRPPFPAIAGLHGRPTVVNNIETLLNVPWILREGAEAYRALGTSASPGTKAFCLNRGFARPGIVEAEFGIGLSELIEGHGGGAAGGGPPAAVIVGGPMGSVLTAGEWDVPVDHPALRARDIRLGHGGIVALADPGAIDAALLNLAEFMAAESCGKCVPCAQGSRRALALVHGLRQSPDAAASLGEDLRRLMVVIASTSLCGFGRGIPRPLLRLVELSIAQRRSPDG